MSLTEPAAHLVTGQPDRQTDRQGHTETDRDTEIDKERDRDRDIEKDRDRRDTDTESSNYVDYSKRNEGEKVRD